jgi:hypothetical protein
MAQYKRTTREPDSLAPIQLDRISVEEEVLQMKTGKGLRLTVTLLLATLAVVGGTRWMGRIDATQAYAHAADQLEAIDSHEGEAFLRCALPNLQASQLSSGSALHSAIEITSERFDKRYAKQLVSCTYLLDELQTSLGTLRAPADMTLRVEALRHSAQDFGQAWSRYRGYLQDPTQRYDFVQATPLIEKIAVAWDNYHAKRDEAKVALRARE